MSENNDEETVYLHWSGQATFVDNANDVSVAEEGVYEVPADREDAYLSHVSDGWSEADDEEFDEEDVRDLRSGSHPSVGGTPLATNDPQGDAEADAEDADEQYVQNEQSVGPADLATEGRGDAADPTDRRADVDEAAVERDTDASENVADTGDDEADEGDADEASLSYDEFEDLSWQKRRDAVREGRVDDHLDDIIDEESAQTVRDAAEERRDAVESEGEGRPAAVERETDASENVADEDFDVTGAPGETTDAEAEDAEGESQDTDDEAE